MNAEIIKRDMKEGISYYKNWDFSENPLLLPCEFADLLTGILGKVVKLSDIKFRYYYNHTKTETIPKETTFIYGNFSYDVGEKLFTCYEDAENNYIPEKQEYLDCFFDWAIGKDYDYQIKVKYDQAGHAEIALYRKEKKSNKKEALIKAFSLVASRDSILKTIKDSCEKDVNFLWFPEYISKTEISDVKRILETKVPEYSKALEKANELEEQGKKSTYPEEVMLLDMGKNPIVKVSEFEKIVSHFEEEVDETKFYVIGERFKDEGEAAE